MSRMFWVEYARKNEDGTFLSKEMTDKDTPIEDLVHMTNFPNTEFMLNWYEKVFLRKGSKPYKVSFGSLFEGELFQGKEYTFITDFEKLVISKESVEEINELAEMFEVIYITRKMDLLEENYRKMAIAESMEHILHMALKGIVEEAEHYQEIIPERLL